MQSSDRKHGFECSTLNPRGGQCDCGLEEERTKEREAQEIARAINSLAWNLTEEQKAKIAARAMEGHTITEGEAQAIEAAQAKQLEAHVKGTINYLRDRNKELTKELAEYRKIHGEGFEFPRDKAGLQGGIAAEMQKWFELAEARRRGLHQQARAIEELKAERDALAEEAHAAAEQLADELQRQKIRAEAKQGWEAGGTKYDSGKPRHDLIDPYAMDTLAKVLTFGAEKYAAHNWRKGIAYSRLIAAAMRHINAINSGDDFDEETGLPHAAHAMCCMMFLVWMLKYRKDMDDRWKFSKDNQPVAEEQITSWREKQEERINAAVNADLSSPDINRAPHPFWHNHGHVSSAVKVRYDESLLSRDPEEKVQSDEEVDLINQAAQHADAIFSQYGVAPRAKQWKPFKIGDGTVISTGDIIKLRDRGFTWVIKEIDPRNMTIAVANANAPDAVLMVEDVPLTDIEQVQR